MNAGGIIQSASDSVEQVFGWTPTELFGQNVKMLIPEPRRSELDRYLDRYRHSDKVKTLQRTGKFNAVRKDGKVIRIEMSISRADLPVHQPPFFIGIVRDVTNLIEAGSDDSDERLRLQSLITEQTRALATANLRLQLADRLASLGTLAAGLGHDMNSVLLPVRAHLNAIEHAGISAQSIGHLTAVRRSISYLQQLSDGLHFLALDPDGSGAAADSEGPTDLGRWWGQVGDLLQKAVPKHVSVQVSLPARMRPINIAPHWLTQAMLNLIVNAGEAIPTTRRKGVVRISAQMTGDGKFVAIEVTDNGRGMSPGIQRRALDLFFTTKPRSLGTGLGLPLARKVATRAGGDIELKSQPGHGTTVVLRIPVMPRRVSKLARPRTGRLCAGVSVREHRVAVLVAHILTSAGVEIQAGRSGPPSGCDLWVTQPTDTTLRAARAWARRRKGGSVVLVGLPKKAARAAWAKLGAHVVEPPGDFEVMRHVLNKVTAEAARQVSPRRRSER